MRRVSSMCGLEQVDHVYLRVPGQNALRRLIGRKPVDKSTFIRSPRFWPSLLDSIALFGGAQWFALKRAHTEYIRQFLESNNAYVRFFRRTYVPDEHFFQSILLNSRYRNEITPRSLTYADWRAWSGSGPRILTSDDYEDLKNSACLFARKFDTAVEASVLDRIDRELLGPE